MESTDRRLQNCGTGSTAEEPAGCEESTGQHLFAEDLRKGAPVRPRGKRVSKYNTAKCRREYREKQTLLHCW